MYHTHRILPLFAAIGVWAALISCPHSAQAAGCVSGQLIKGATHAVYYCGADGKRYVFPDIKTYQTWYPDFSTVNTISDSALASIQLGGNVTYKPGVRLIKITTDPKVYAVDAGGLLHAIASEAVAQQLYGSAWNKAVDDVPDAFFVNYRLGADVAAASQFLPSSVTVAADSINHDRGLIGGEASAEAGVTLELAPAVATLTSGQSTVVTVNVSDPAGILTASIFLNGELLKTCSQTGYPATAACSTTLYGGDYADGSRLTVYGQGVNRNAARVISSSATIATSGGKTSSNGSVTLSFSNDSVTLNAGQSTTVTVSANDTAGISSVSIFVNGTLIQSCGQSGLNVSATCQAAIYGSNYPSGSTLAVYGQEINKNGSPTISATSNLSVTVGSSTGGSVSLSFSPNATTLAVGDSMTVLAAAADPLGLTNISVFANGAVVQNCGKSGANVHENCSATIYGSNYSSGTAIAVYAQATNSDGKNIVSSTTNVNIVAGGSLNRAVSLSFSPYATYLAAGQATTVSVSARDSVNISTVSVYVNDALVQTCRLAGTSTTGTCSTVISGSNYSNGSTVSVYGQASNVNGASSVSPTSTLTISSAAAGNGSVMLFVSPAVSAISGTQTATVTVNAYDPAGLASVNVFVNGANAHSCSQSGIWPTGASCALTISAGSYAHGTTLSIYGQGVNTSGTATSSAVSSLTIN